jgi:hypothetical protein
VLPPCGKAIAYYLVEDAHGEEGIMDFSNYESMRPRMDEIKKRLVRAVVKCERQEGAYENAINNQNHKTQRRRYHK